MLLSSGTWTETCVCVCAFMSLWFFWLRDEKQQWNYSTTHTLSFSLQLKDSEVAPSPALLSFSSSLHSSPSFTLLPPFLLFLSLTWRQVSFNDFSSYLSISSPSSHQPVTFSRDWGCLCSSNQRWYPCHWSSWLRSLLLADQRQHWVAVHLVGISECVCVCVSLCVSPACRRYVNPELCLCSWYQWVHHTAGLLPISWTRDWWDKINSCIRARSIWPKDLTPSSGRRSANFRELDKRNISISHANNIKWGSYLKRQLSNKSTLWLLTSKQLTVRYLITNWS